MAVGKAVRHVVLLLVLAYNLEVLEYFPHVFFQALPDANTSSAHHAREKRETPASRNTTEYEVQVGINVSDLAEALEALNRLEFPVLLSSDPEILSAEFEFLSSDPEILSITSITATTACSSPPEVGFRCRCLGGFAWPLDRCDDDGCGSSEEDLCRCRTGIPADGQYCQSIALLTVDFDMVVEVRVSASSVAQIKRTLQNAVVPTLVTRSINLTAADLTTVCDLEAECLCEDGFAWPAARCESNPCSNVTCNTCTCISSRPEDGSFCEPFQDVAQCMNTTMSPSTTPPTTETVEVTLDREFDAGFNEAEAPNINRIIQEQAAMHIVSLSSVTEATFRSGSTIISFNVTAPVITADALNALREGLFTELSQQYPIIFDSPQEIEIQPRDVFFSTDVTLTCGQPPLNFTTVSVEWTHNGATIPEDTDVLIMPDILPTDAGEYECLRRNGNGSIFRQRANVSVLDEPVIHVNPIRRTVSCDDETVPVECFVEGNHTVFFAQLDDEESAQRITSNIDIPEDCGESERTVTCVLMSNSQFRRTITLTFTRSNIVCDDERFGQAVLNFRAAARCENGSVGEVTAVCRESTEFEDVQDNCVLARIQMLLEWSEFVDNMTLAVFLDDLSNTTIDLADDVVESQATIIAIVRILNNVAEVASTTVINQTLMEDVLLTTSVLTRDAARESWEALFEVTLDPSETTIPATSSFDDRLSESYSFVRTFSSTRTLENVSISSLLLLSLETITTRVINETLDFDTPLILFDKESVTGSFNIDSDAVEIDIPDVGGFVTAITFISMENVLPARDEANSSSRFINGRVVLVQSTNAVDNVSFAYDRLNASLANPQCVFWNFSLFDGLGGWDDEGCQFVMSVNNTFTCACDHLTSFSILMSIGTPDSLALTVITYIGLGISLASLVVCLIIEAIVWRKISNNRTSYLRHVSIVNIAVSLLIANIWLIVAFNISEQRNMPVCIAATFFIHFFYLALFFWMFASALLLLYRTVSIFGGDLSKSSMLAIGFCIGYGGPIIIAAITIATTSPDNEYIRRSGGCWLNWVESRALLAFVVPALLIVLINFIILIIVMYKILRSRTAGLSSTQPNDKHVVVVILRSLAILTPLFGLTWALGVGTIFDQQNLGLHISFSFFNSLQGFFVLVFGTLVDKKVRSEIASISTSGSGTRSTSGGNSSGLGIFRRLRQNRDGYHVSSSSPPQNTSSNT